MLTATIANILAGYLYLAGPLEEKSTIIIKQGLSTREISQILSEKNIISSAKLFEVIAKIYSIRRPLKSGEYAFTIGISPLQVIRKLASGRSVVHQLTIVEGTTVNEIIRKLNDSKILEGVISTYIPEGYLMPSTYFYSYGDKRENILAKMKVGMSYALDEMMAKLSPHSPLKTRKDVLILASIIEKEAGNDNEKAKIAAVFINRLNKNMKLQADPTTIYAITEGKYKLSRLLTRADLKIKSPYNTYYIYGLPPEAIACPGKKSLEAAVNPAISDDLFFVVDGNGGHNFSKTLSEHNNYVQSYRSKDNSN